MAVCLLSVAALAQSESFGDLSRRAESVLDSRPAEAAGLYKQALAIRPDWAEGWLYMGGALYQTNRYAEASDAFRRGIALEARQGTAHAFLGLCEAELDSPEQALADIRKGEQLGLGENLQFEVAVRLRAALLLIRSSSFDEALNQLIPLANRGVNPAMMAGTMGLCALGLRVDKFADLTAEQRAMVNLAGKAAWAGANSHPEESIASYKQLLEQYPSGPGVHYAHGLYLMETDLKAALAEFQAEIKNTPNHWPSLLVYSSLLIREGSTDQAIEALRQALRIVPAKYRWLCHAEIGRANLNGDRLDAAIAELRIAIKGMPSIAQLHFFLSQAYRRSGQMDESQKETAEFQRLKVLQDPLGVPALQSVYSNVRAQ